MSSGEQTERKSTGQTAMDFQLFSVSALVSAVDMLRYRMAHLEVTLKGEKAGPYEASQIPPPITTNKAYNMLQEIWRGCTGQGPECEDLLIGVTKSDEEIQAEISSADTVVVPGLDTEAFELENQARAEAANKEKDTDEVVTLEADEGDDDDEDDSGVFELE